MTLLSATERENLPEADRAMLDAAVQAIPPEFDPVFTALMLSNRAIVRHDTAGIKAAIGGYGELLDTSDERQRELVETAKSMQATTARFAVALQTQAAFDGRLATIEAELKARSARDQRADTRMTLVSIGLAWVILRHAYVAYTGWDGFSLDALSFAGLGLIVTGVLWWRNLKRGAA